MHRAHSSAAAPVTLGAHAAARRLSPAEREVYDAQGFVAVSKVFSGEELSAINAEIDRIVTERSATGAGDGESAGGRESTGHNEQRGWVMQLGLASQATRDFAQDERILNLIEGIVQPGIAIYSAKLVTKLPHSEDICHWHQDDAYYRSHSHSDCRCSIWVPLQDADERNGCLWVVPGSHRAGMQSHARKDWGTCQLSMDESQIDLSKAIPLPVQAGDMVIFSALLWHHSKNNHTDRIRRAFIVSYQEATAAGGNGAQWKILRPAV